MRPRLTIAVTWDDGTVDVLGSLGRLIMAELWDNGPATMAALVARLNASGDGRRRADSTVSTTVYRLRDAGMVRRNGRGSYEPTIDREAFNAQVRQRLTAAAQAAAV